MSEAFSTLDRCLCATRPAWDVSTSGAFSLDVSDRATLWVWNCWDTGDPGTWRVRLSEHATDDNDYSTDRLGTEESDTGLTGPDSADDAPGLASAIESAMVEFLARPSVASLI